MSTGRSSPLVDLWINFAVEKTKKFRMITGESYLGIMARFVKIKIEIVAVFVRVEVRGAHNPEEFFDETHTNKGGGVYHNTNFARKDFFF